MKALIAALIFAFAITVSAKNLTPNFQNQDKKQTVTNTDTKTTVSKDGKIKSVTNKISKSKKDCKGKGSCCDSKTSK